MTNWRIIMIIGSRAQWVPTSSRMKHYSHIELWFYFTAFYNSCWLNLSAEIPYLIRISARKGLMFFNNVQSINYYFKKWLLTLLKRLSVCTGILTTWLGWATGSCGSNKSDIMKLASRHLDLLDIGSSCQRNNCLKLWCAHASNSDGLHSWFHCLLNNTTWLSLIWYWTFLQLLRQSLKWKYVLAFHQSYWKEQPVQR